MPDTFIDPSLVPAEPQPAQRADPRQSIDGGGHSAIDPNTLQPVTPTAPTVAGQIANEHQQFTDAWKANPTGAPPVRTWVDASEQRVQGPDGEYLDAWHDQPAEVVNQPNPSGLPGEVIATVAAPAPAPTPAPTAAPAAPQTVEQFSDAGYRQHIDEGGVWWEDPNGTPVATTKAGTPNVQIITQ